MSYNEKLRCDNLTTNHEGATAWRLTPEWELYTTVVTTMGTEDKFYENGEDRVRRIADLVRKVEPVFVAQLAIYTRETMHLRSVPLLLLVELARCHHGDNLVSKAVSCTVQRADEIAELLMCYQWRTGRKDLTGLSNQLRKGLAESFNHFDEYQFAKYNRTDRKVTLRDALLLVHPKPKDEHQAEIFRKIMSDTLETPYTWETELSSVGQQSFESKEELKEAKRETWRRLVRSRRMGYMATLRNLRNLLCLGMDDQTMQMVCDFIADPEAVHKSKQLPFRFLSAYMELVGNPSSFYMYNNPLTIKQDDILRRLKKAQALVQTLSQGFCFTSVRKVKRFYPSSTLSIANRTTIPKEIGRQLHKSHYRITTNVMMPCEHTSERCRQQIARIERQIARLQKQYGRVNHVLHKSSERRIRRQYGENGLRVIRALEIAACHTAANIPGFDENTQVLLASDTSGSMMRSVSQNSSVQCYHIGLLLSMLMKHRCKDAVAGMFGSIWKTYPMPSDCILQNTLDMMMHEGEVGYATNGYKVIEWLIANRRVMDKVMLFTDCQLWDSEWGDANLSRSWDRYKEIAPRAKLYLFDLAGYGQSPVSMVRDDVFCIAGWSDKVFDVLATLERGNNAIDEIRRIVV